MYRTRRRVRAFSILDQMDMGEYEAVLNNQNAIILSEKQIKKVDREYEDGQVVGSNETLYLVVTWEEQELL